MIRRLLTFAALLVVYGSTAMAQPNLPYSFYRDPNGRPIMGSGVRPTVTAEMGIPIGTPFFDTSTFSQYYWSGSAWVAANAAGGTLSSPTITSPTISGATISTTSLTSPTFTGYISRSGTSKSLTDAAAATPFAVIAVATNGHMAGELKWIARSVSTPDQLVASGAIRFWGTDTAGTPVCGINTIGTAGEGHSGGANTLVCTWTNVVSTTNCALSVTCTNDLAAAQAITLYGSPEILYPIPATVSFP